MRRVSLASICFAAALVAAPLSAQDVHKVVKRPELPAGADTNDAVTYMRYGIDQLDHDPNKAAAAFYWATRIDPTMSEAFYARRIAYLLADHSRLVSYLERSGKTVRSPEVRRIDSLQIRALALNPFLYRRFDRRLLTDYLFELGRRNGVDAAEMNAYILESRHHLGPWMSAWFAYCDSRFPVALEQYAKASEEDKDAAYGAHAERGRIFFIIGNYDSALTEMTAAIDGMRKKDDKDLVFVYDSKAVYEESIGLIEEHLGKPDAAREAYGRALSEDLSYYPAHQRLAELALAKGDTATALSEMDLAVQLAGSEPAMRYEYGALLIAAGKDTLAEAQFRKAIELEPYYAAPYQYLARILDARGRPDEAIPQYEAFLARAPKREPFVGWVRDRVLTLRAARSSARSTP
ncbi:MAG TPA: tetratricopeptide repeat protein [Gemmatimonadaceae bacterium]